MRDLSDPEFHRCFIRTEWAHGQIGEHNNKDNAVMLMPYPRDGSPIVLRIIASRGGGWDHVSVSLADRTPSWAEMDFVKRRLFYPHEVAVQFHVAERDHVNIHPFTLHLWRHHHQKYKLPSKGMI